MALRRDLRTLVLSADNAHYVGPVLTRNTDGCLAVDTGAELSPIQFPHGTELLDDGSGVDVPGLGRVLLGETFEGGGGFTSLEQAPAECEAETYALWQTVIDER